MSLDSTTSASAMDYACRSSNQPFLDLRSAGKARHRARAKLEKYNHFRRPGLTRGDLPSFQGQQQSHYLPICYLPECPTKGTVDGCWLRLFPADLSTAPIAKFTKREAYQDAQLWPRPPTYHRSSGRSSWTIIGKRRKYSKKFLDEELRSREWYDDVEYFKYHGEELRDMDSFDRYCYFRQHADWFESEEDDVRNTPDEPIREDGPTNFVEADNENDEGYCSTGEAPAQDETALINPSDAQPAAGTEEQDSLASNSTAATSSNHSTVSDKPWFWHRNFAGGWFRAGYKECQWDTCGCVNKCVNPWCYPNICNDEYWDDRPRTAIFLDEWLDGSLEHACQSIKPTVSTGALSEVSCDETFQTTWGWALEPWEHSGKSRHDAQSEMSDWDMVSNSSEAWTEVGETASGTDSMGC